jgi:peptide/nickel transport system substrate-binding protein
VDVTGLNDVKGLTKLGLFSLAQDFSTATLDWYQGIADHLIVPNIAKDGVFSEDYKVFTLYLREGMKWSDGEPLTVDDFLFWWEDIVNNEEVVPDIPKVYQPGDTPMEVRKIDDYTVELRFAQQNPFFDYYMCDTAVRQEPLRPAHYLKQFHIKYNEDADALAKENNFDTWWELFNAKGGVGPETGDNNLQNPDIPVLWPWVTTEYRPELWTGERNPYFFKIDTEGNQLPYIDKVVCDISSNTDVLMAKVVGGQVDYSAVALPFSDIPVLKDAEVDGDFTTYLWDTPMGAMPSILFNQTYPEEEDPFLRELFKDVRFRRAMSLAINREEANQVAYFGVSYPTQATALPGSKFLKPEYQTAYAEYDPEEANRLLDEIGLAWDANNEFRLRPDGKPLTIVLEDIDVGAIRGYSKIRPLLKEYWEDVGVRIVLKEQEVSLWVERFFAGLVQLSMWGLDSMDDFNFQILGPWLIPGTSYGGTTWHAHGWQNWVNSDGEEGEEPPAEVKKMRELWLEMNTSTDPDEVARLGQEIFGIQAENVYVIGVVGSIKQPVVLKNNIGNVLADGVWANNTSAIQYGWPFQWYFK